MQDQPFPYVSLELLEALQEHFPDRSPDLRWSDREVWFKAGQCSVVRFLKAKFDEQNENILKRPL